MRSHQLYIFGTILLLFLSVFVGARMSPSQTKEDPPGVTLINKTKFEIVKRNVSTILRQLDDRI